jgi:hypothetical protein
MDPTQQGFLDGAAACPPAAWIPCTGSDTG